MTKCSLMQNILMQVFAWSLLNQGFPAYSEPLISRQSSAIVFKSLANPVWSAQDLLRDPSVLKTDNGYLLFYSRLKSAGNGWGDPASWTIACAFTKDFQTFTNDHDVSPTGFASPGDVVFWHGRYILPYQSYPASPTQLCFSESSDLKTWSEPQPFLTEACNLPWNSYHRVIDPTLVIEGETLHCYFVGSADHINTSGKKFRANLMGHAVTRDSALKQWEILTVDKPLIGVSEQAPDGVENTMVFQTGDFWAMIYSEGLANQHLAWATSKDLRTWQFKGPIELPRQDWMSKKYGAPFVWKEPDQWLMILMGENNQGRTTFGLLTSPDGSLWTLLPEKVNSKPKTKDITSIGEVRERLLMDFGWRFAFGHP